AWMVGKPYASTFSTFLMPNSRFHDMVSMSIGFFSARSAHPGVVNALYVDGSVRAVADNVEKKLWRASATIAEGD
ncbi:MAG: DUF1559 domain-containing protein, partial [Thermoguttaceae bacterium]|nr:DUF1559 domain-containing protein [Thermoguttaceae bacterium]